MYKIAIIGFGSIGIRYLQAINRIQLPNIKLFIIDKKIKIQSGQNNLKKKIITKSNNIKFIPKKVDLCIISTTCQNRDKLLKELTKQSNFKNLILEKPLTQSPKELLKLNIILEDKKNIWVNTDRRILKVYKFIKSNLNIKNKLLMNVEGNNWGICCNSLHFIDLFNFLCDEYSYTIKEKSNLKWIHSKRNGFKELENGKLELKFGIHKLCLSSKKNSLPKNLKISIKNGKKNFLVKEKIDVFELKYNKKKKIFKNEPTSIKMTSIIKKILLENKSNLPNYLVSSILYYPLIEYFLRKWQIYNPRSKKAPIT